MEANARKRFVFLSDSAAKQPHIREKNELTNISGCQIAVSGSRAVTSIFKTRASVATFTGSMKNAVMGSGLPS
jgi:hypothetical protein